MLTLKRLLFIPCLFFFFWGNARARQKASVNGYVKDATTGETLISANIAIDGTTIGTSSNTSGYYTLPDLNPGTYTLLCSYIGYARYSKKITLKAGQSLRLNIEMRPERTQLQGVVVKSTSDKEEKNKIGMSQISTNLIKELPSVLQADVFRSIQLLPGVKSASDFSSGLYIRGGSPDQTLILLDGTTVYNPTHFFGFFSTFNPDAIKDVRLYKGGYPAKYGGRLGSVLAIYNKDGNSKHTDGSVTLGLLASRAFAEGPYSSKGSWMLAIRRSTLEPVLSILSKTVNNIPKAFYFWDANGKVNYNADDLNKLSLAFYAGQDYIDFPFASDASIRLKYGNNTFSTKWTHLFSNKVFSNLTLTGSRYFNYPQFDIASTPFHRSNNVYDMSLKGDIQYIPNQQHQFEAGFWSGMLTLKLKDNFNNQDVFSSRIHSRYTAAYVQDTWDPSVHWELVYGLRLNYFSRGNYLRLAPRLSLEYRPISNLRFQAAYGRYDQFLTLVTNQAFSGFDTWLTTAKGVPPSYGDQYVLGVKEQPSEGYDINVEGYYRTMEHLFELNPFIPDPAGLEYRQLFRFGTGYAYGVETKLEKSTGRFNGYIGYTYSVTRRKFPGFNQDRFFPPRYDRRNDITLVANYQLSRRWKTTLVFTYATGQAYTKPLGRTVIIAPFTSGGLDLLTVGKVNASRLPSYNRMDIGFTRTGTFFGLWPAQLQLQVINVYSHRNVWFYNYDFNQNPIQKKAVLMLPIIPSITYTIKFR